MQFKLQYCFICFFFFSCVILYVSCIFVLVNFAFIGLCHIFTFSSWCTLMIARNAKKYMQLQAYCFTVLQNFLKLTVNDFVLFLFFCLYALSL